MQLRPVVLQPIERHVELLLSAERASGCHDAGVLAQASARGARVVPHIALELCIVVAILRGNAFPVR